jgi:hypothetical protein
MSKSDSEIRYDCFVLATQLIPQTDRFDLDLVLDYANRIVSFVENRVQPDAPVRASVAQPVIAPAEPTPVPPPPAPEPEPTLAPVASAPKEEPKGRKAIEKALKQQQEESAAEVEQFLVDDDPERRTKIDSLVAELNPTDRIVMRKLLQRVETKYLESAFNQYLTKVLGK